MEDLFKMYSCTSVIFYGTRVALGLKILSEGNLTSHSKDIQSQKHYSDKKEKEKTAIGPGWNWLSSNNSS